MSTAGHAATLTHVDRDAEREDTQRPLSFALIARLIGYMRPYRLKRNLLFVIVVLRSIQLPALAWTIGAVINGPIAGHDVQGTILGAAGFLALAAFTQLTFHYRSLLALQLGEAVVHDLRRDLFQHLLVMQMSFFDTMKRGRIISRVMSDVEAVRVGVQNVLFVTLVLAGQMIVAAAMMAYYDLAMFGIVLVIAPVLWGLNRLFRKRFSAATRAIQESFSRVTATLAESVSGIRVTQGFVRQDVNAGIFRQLVVNHSRYSVERARTAGVFLPLLQLNSQLFIALLLLLGGYRVLHAEGGMTIGTLIQFFFLAGIFFQPLQGLGNVYNDALTAMAGAERVFTLLDRAPDWQDAPDAHELPTIKGRVEFQHLTFGYDPANPVLRDINAVVEPGQIIALVGATGSGKSTFINLIAKFYLPTEGKLLIDGHEIRCITSRSLHRQLGIIQQQNFVFTGSIMDNIKVGRPGTTDGDVIAAARALDCLDLIEALPNGFEAHVGEEGVGLSLGQRQLVCFIRAMLANPRILILDEATSSVDTMTEARIQKSLETLMRNRTCFVVAHRLSTIRHADLVLVFADGEIVERGTHNELLAEGKLYADLYRQFATTSS